MATERKIENLLVVLSPEMLRNTRAWNTALIRRAVALARQTDCSVELFHVSYDPRLDLSLFTSRDDRQRARKRLTDRDATRVADLAARLRREHVDVRHEVRWDPRRTDAILTKAAESMPDIVMKQSRDHGYILGLVSNTDWELGRRSPADLWLVNENTADIERIIAAIGNDFGNPADITTAPDYDLMQAVAGLKKALDARVFPVNAYQLPTEPHPVTAIGAMPLVTRENQHGLREKTLRAHEFAVKSVADYFRFGTDDVIVCEGNPNDVIPDVAEKIGADLIAMGARSIGRLERLIGPVTLEPVMSAAECDILVVRDNDPGQLPNRVAPPVFGEPKYDLERAVTHPGEAFESPLEIARATELSHALRKRILQLWEYDVRAEMAAETEGGNTGDIDAGVLEKIRQAREILSHEETDRVRETRQMAMPLG